MIKASIVVEFGAGVSGLAKVELDDIKNEEKTTFLPGSLVYFLVHLDDSLEIEWIKTTSGGVQGNCDVTLERREFMTFIDEDTVTSLNYLPNGNVVPTWYGNEAEIRRDFNSMSVLSGEVPAICEVVYPVPFSSHILQTPQVELDGDDTWPIAVVVRVVKK